MRIRFHPVARRVALGCALLACALCAAAASPVQGQVPRETYLKFEVSDYVEVGDDNALDLGGGEFSISAWIRPESWGQNRQGRIVDHGGGSAGGDGWTLAIENRESAGSPRALRMQINNSSAFDGTSDVGVLSLNVWQHVAVTFTGGTLRMYVNGQERGVRTGVPVPLPSAQPVRIGMRATDTNRGFLGDIDEVRIWDRALTQQEILANTSAALTGFEPGLVAYYRLDENSGQVAADGSFQGRDGRLGSTTLADGEDPLWMTAPPPANTAPLVDAGPDTTIILPNDTVALEGNLGDDGLPSGTLTPSWSQISGPTTVSFADASSTDTTATLPQGGTYVLRLSVDDGELSAADEVTVAVAIANDTDPPLVAITSPVDSSLVSGSVTISATASDNDAILAVELLVDSVAVETFTGEPYALEWDSTQVATGLHTITVLARDLTGNEASASIDVTVDNGAPADLTGWTVQQYSFGGTDNAVWTPDPNDAGAVQNSSTAFSSILLSDFVLDHSTAFGFTGSLGVEADSDDDQIGFVLGYQDAGELYLFQWKRGDPQNPLFADIGMHLRAVSTGAASPTDADFEGAGSTPNSTILFENDLRWVADVEYSFSIRFTPAGFDLTIDDPTDTNDVFWQVADATFTTGRIGFFNGSQRNAVYRLASLGELPCADSDADAVCNAIDNCLLLPNPTQLNSDGDGFGDACDNCPNAANESQDDADGDGIGNACDACPDDPGNDVDTDGFCAALDCDNTNPGVHDRPVEVTDVNVEAVPGGFRLSWSSQASIAGPDTSYDVFSGTISDLRATGEYSPGSCEHDNRTAASYDDLGPSPAPGEGLYFLVRAQNACPSGTGTFGDGNRDATAEISAAACD